MSARLLTGETESQFIFFRWFNAGFEALSRLVRLRASADVPVPLDRDGRLRARADRDAPHVRAHAHSFIPSEDQGYFIVLVQAPEGTSLSGETAISKRAEEIIRQQPQVRYMFNVGGFSFTGSAPNRGFMFVLLKPWAQRKAPQDDINAVHQPHHTTASSRRFRKRKSLRSIRRRSTASPASADSSSSSKIARASGCRL